MATPVVLVVHGPSGVGKDTVINRLRARTGIPRATSSTSRAPRVDEENHQHYHFYTPEEFERRLAAGEFVESAMVYGDWKGLERRELEEPIANGEDVIIRTDVQGARAWRKKLEGAVFVILLVEDRDVLRKQLECRGSEDAESLARRLAELDEELADLENNDYVVYNRHGDPDSAVTELERIIEAERNNPDRPAPRLLA